MSFQPAAPEGAVVHCFRCTTLVFKVINGSCAQAIVPVTPASLPCLVTSPYNTVSQCSTFATITTFFSARCLPAGGDCDCHCIGDGCVSVVVVCCCICDAACFIMSCRTAVVKTRAVSICSLLACSHPMSLQPHCTC